MISTLSRRAAHAVWLGACIAALGACGGGGGGGGGPTPPASGPQIIGGSVSGLAGTLELQNNGGETASVSADGGFSFATPATDYAVTVLSQPASQTCAVSSGGSGTATTTPVTNIVVECAVNPVVDYTIGGTASGLTGSVVLRNNGGDDLSVTANGAFVFATPSSAYAVTVLSQPGGQVCSVGNGNGTASTAVSDVALSCTTTLGTLAPLAGNFGGAGSGEGTGAAARFNGPQGVAVDAAGNVYVADGGNQSIRKISPAGLTTTFAGSAGVSGGDDGAGAAARLSNPQGIAIDGAGNVFVADTGNHTIRRITPAGVVSTLAGFAGLNGSVDSVKAGARFNLPTGVAVDSLGNVFVADSGNHTIRRVTPAGVVSTFAGLAGSAGSADGTAAAARFDTPLGVAVDSANNLFVSDSNNHTIRRITPAGVVSTFAGSPTGLGSVDGTGALAQFGRTAGVSTDSAGNVYVTEFESYLIRRITPAAEVTTLAGSAGLNGATDATGAAARFYRPFGVATDVAGNAYIADTGNSLIRKMSPVGAVITLAGSVAIGGSFDGTGAAARFLSASGVTTDSAGNAFVADRLDHTIRRITPAGVVTTFAGAPGASGAVDDTGNAALFSSPVGVATDGADNIYVADRANHAIRKISPAGVVTTLAGSMGTSGSADGAAAAARFQFPEGVAVDSAGNVYVADTGNHTVRKIDLAGMVTTLAGLAGDAAFADGTTTAARFNAPVGIAIDAAGDIVVTDASDTIRRVTPAGVVSTIAGLPLNPGSADGAGTTARFNAPTSVATDSAGNWYVADRNNGTIRRVTPAGAVATIVGVAGQSGFTAGALPGVLTTPVAGVTVRGTTMIITMPAGVAVVQGLQ